MPPTAEIDPEMIETSEFAETELLQLRRQHLLRRVVVYSAALGFAADLLLRQAPWGLHLSVWLALVIGTTFDLSRRQSHVGSGPWLLAPAALFVLLGVWRASPLLVFMNLVAVLVFLAFYAAAAADARFFARGAAELHEILRRLGRVVFQTVFGGVMLVLGEDRAIVLPDSKAWRVRLSSVLAGVATVALLTVMASLLAAGDAVFRSQLSAIIQFDFANAVSHVVLVLGAAWLLLGAWRHTLGDAAPSATSSDSQQRKTLTVSLMPLNGLVALVAVFVAGQLRTLVGGADYVARTTGLTLAEYARSGFFALCPALALALVVVLGYQTLVRQSDQTTAARFRPRALVLALLLAALTLGALVRMRYYIDGFGLTDDRLYSSVFMVWIAFLAAWLARCVWVARPTSFARGALAVGSALLLSLNALNAEALIVRVNAARLATGHDFDMLYATKDLSADAVPELLRVVLRENPHAARAAFVPRCSDVESLLSRWSESAEDAERTWRWGEYRAYRAVRAQEARVDAMPCVPSGPATPSVLH